MAMRLGVQRALRAPARRVLVARSFSSFEHAADKFVVSIPEEHDGLNIEFNWSLADDDVTPYGDAYRNLRWSKLAEFAKDVKPAGKAFKVREVDVDASFAEYESAFENVTAHLSQLDNLFAQDGALGSFKDNRTRTRVITDSPLVALFAQNLLVRVPTKDPHAARPIVVYVATEGEFKGKEPQALLFLDKDEAEQLFVKVVITGAADLSAVKDAIALAKKKLAEHTEAESLVLPGDVLLKNDKTALVFNISAAGRAQNVNAGQLYAAHSSIWGPAGVTSLFGGAIVDAGANQKKQAVATEEGAAVHVPCNNIVDAPAAAIFVSRKGSGVKPISVEEASSLLTAVDADADAEKFVALLKQSSTKTFAVGSDADIDAALAKL
ncbi:hypothetical protein ATCC90586_007493 [Pythium insidiosum]|nr:hypothetical protein ATCC90586_007493 [Pythium insidiosum]